jgi:hypothetical protein
MRPIPKSLTERIGPKAPTYLYGPLGLNYHPLEKINMTADSLENPVTSHDLCDVKHREQVEYRVKTLFKTVGKSFREGVIFCGIEKLGNI